MVPKIEKGLRKCLVNVLIHPCICLITNIYLAFAMYKIMLDNRNIPGSKSNMVSDLMELKL